MKARAKARLKPVGNARRYVRWVPRKLRGAAGLSAWIHYFGVEVSAAEAQRKAIEYDAHYDVLQRYLERLDDAALEAMEAEGGFPAVEACAIAADQIDNESIEVLRGLADWAKRSNFEPDGSDPHELAFGAWKLEKTAEDIERDAAERRRKRPTRTKLDDGRGLGALLAIVAKTHTDASLKRARLYVMRFVEWLGSNKEPTTVTLKDVVGWRNHLFDSGMSAVNQAQHLAKMSALFSAAIDDGVVAGNPFAGVRAKAAAGEIDARQEKRAFTSDELATFTSAVAEQTSIKVIVPPPTLSLIVRTLMLTGARSSEICGLRACDVRQVEGVLVFDINMKLRQLKNRAARRLIPVPSMLVAEILAAASGKPDDAMLFDSLRERAQGPAHQMQIDASKVLRKHVTTDRSLTTHCLRHTWRQRAEASGVAPAVRRAIMGHSLGKDAHDSVYGARPPVKELAKAIELVADALGKSK